MTVLYKDLEKVQPNDWKERPELWFNGVGLEKQSNPIGGQSKVVSVDGKRLDDWFTPRIRNKMDKDGVLAAYVDIEVDTFNQINFNILLSDLNVNGIGLGRIKDCHISQSFLIKDQEGDWVNVHNMKGTNNSFSGQFHERRTVHQFMHNPKLIEDLQSEHAVLFDSAILNKGTMDSGDYGKGIVRVLVRFPEGGPVQEGYTLNFKGHVTYLNDVTEGFKQTGRTLNEKASSRERNNTYGGFGRRHNGSGGFYEDLFRNMGF